MTITIFMFDGRIETHNNIANIEVNKLIADGEVAFNYPKNTQIVRLLQVRRIEIEND